MIKMRLECTDGDLLLDCLERKVEKMIHELAYKDG